jgi:prepilin signal peptidase PulO-like enzyme (type II secretory pathway)
MSASIVTPFLISYLLVAAIVDLRQRLLPAWLTLGGIASGLLVATTAGNGTLLLSLVGLLVGGGVLLPFALLGGVGWADVLLLGAVGAWEGWDFALRTAGCTALTGAILAVVAWRRGQRVFPYVPAIALGVLVASVTG